MSGFSGRTAFVWFVTVTCILLGVYFRVTNLDARSYTNDEATTSIRSAGSSLAEWGTLFDGRIRTVDQLLPYQTLVPGRTTIDTVRALALEDPQHPPLYYVLDRWWIEVFGSSVAQRRGLSALAGCLVIGLAFLVGMEIDGTFWAGLVCAALFAVSPFQIAYSQQAREYSLWSLLALTTTWLLLRFIRLHHSWYLLPYTLVVAAGLYTDLLFAGLLLGHAAMIGVLARRRAGASLSWLIAVIVAVVSFLPWLEVVRRGSALLTNNDYLGAKLPASIFLAKWAFNAATLFVDLEYRYPTTVIILPVVAVICLICAVAAAGQRKSATLVVTSSFIIPSGLLALASDILRHESRSTAGRYLVPVWIGIELLVALGIVTLLRSTRVSSRTLGVGALLLIAAVGATSAVVSARASWSWTDASVAPIAPVATIINSASERPLLIYKSDPTRWDFTVAQLINVLRKDVQIQLVSATEGLAPRTQEPEFLLDPNAMTRSEARGLHSCIQPRYVEGPSQGDLGQFFRTRARAARIQEHVADERISLWQVTGTC